MAIDRPLYPLQQTAPLGPVDVPVDMRNEVQSDGSVLVDFGGPDAIPQVPHGGNLAEAMDDKDLSELASGLTADYEADKRSRKEWEETYIKGLDLLGLTMDDRTEPWDGACGVFHPMLAEAVVRFQSQTIQEIFPASGPAKTSIVGVETPERLKQATRVEDYLNYLTTKTMVEYRNEKERLLFSLPIAGSAFSKVYDDPNLGREVAMFVPAEDLIVSYGAADLSTCERITHRMKRTENDVRKLQVNGFYRDIDLRKPTADVSDIQRKEDQLAGQEDIIDVDSRHTLLEMQVELDLKGFEDADLLGVPTGVALPYVVTIEHSSREILAIYRNWKEQDQKKLKREHVVHYQYLPGLGFYGFGLVHMIGGLSKSATSLLRQLIDSGTLANLPGGLKARGLRIKGDDSPIMPGEFRDVDVPSGRIQDNLAFLPYKEPSGVLYQLLVDIVQEGRRFASAGDVKASDINGEAPVGTTLAILEREMKVLSAIQGRIHASMGKELQLIAQVVKDRGTQQYPYDVDGEFTVAQDFDERIDVIPVSDPNAGTMAQRIMQYQAALQLSATAPQMYDMPFLHRQMLEILGIRDAAKIVPTEDDMIPTDPVTENQNLMTGSPVKAFLYQDHEAHITTHISAAQHPELVEMLKQTPQAKTIQAAFAAHIAEHLAMAYRHQVEQELGVELPDPTQALPEDIELRLSRLVAPAAAQLTGKAQQQKQAEENAKKQQDPIIQMQQKELAIKEGSAKAKAVEGMAKIQADLKQSADKDALERDKLASKERTEAAKLIVDVVEGQENLRSKEQVEGFKIGQSIADRLLGRNKDK